MGRGSFMTVSFKEAAATMDPVAPARTVKELARQHRWPNVEPGELPNSISLREMLDRHRPSVGVKARFLWLNTALLRIAANFQAPAAVVAGGVAGIYAGAAAFGPLGVAVGAIFGRLFGGKVVHDVTTLEKVVESTTFVNPRSKELGEILRAHLGDGFDVVALCEVFGEDERSRILSAWPTDSQPAWHGPPHGAEGEVSLGFGAVSITLDPFLLTGLLSLSPTFQKSDDDVHFFTDQGEPERDADAWSSKGVLKVSFDLHMPNASLDVYTTHMFHGGGLDDVPVFGFGGDPTESQAIEIRQSQLEELIEFVKSQRKLNPRNVSIVAGDFNIEASSGAEAENLQRRMAVALNMDDLWATRNGTRGSTIVEDEDDSTKLGKICSVNSGLCDDSVRERQTGQRVDYIFVERSTAEHGFTLDFTRPRRVPFRRQQGVAGRSKVPFLSDHIGLTTTLIATPR